MERVFLDQKQNLEIEKNTIFFLGKTLFDWEKDFWIENTIFTLEVSLLD